MPKSMVMDAIRQEIERMTREELIVFMETHVGNSFEDGSIRKVLVDDVFDEYKSYLISFIVSSMDEKIDDDEDMEQSTLPLPPTIPEEEVTLPIDIDEDKKEKSCSLSYRDYCKIYNLKEVKIVLERVTIKRKKKKFHPTTLKMQKNTLPQKKMVYSSPKSEESLSDTDDDLKVEEVRTHLFDHVILNERGVRLLPHEIKGPPTIKVKTTRKVPTTPVRSIQTSVLQDQRNEIVNSWIMDRILEQRQNKNVPKRAEPRTAVIAPTVKISTKNKTTVLLPKHQLNNVKTPSPHVHIQQPEKILRDRPQPTSSSVCIDLADDDDDISIMYENVQHTPIPQQGHWLLPPESSIPVNVEPEPMELVENGDEEEGDSSMYSDSDELLDDDDVTSVNSNPEDPVTEVEINEHSIAAIKYLNKHREYNTVHHQSGQRLIDNITQWLLANEREPFFHSSPSIPEDSEDDYQTMAQVPVQHDEDVNKENAVYEVEEERFGAGMVDGKTFVRIGGSGVESVVSCSEGLSFSHPECFKSILTVTRGHSYDLENFKAKCNICKEGSIIQGPEELARHLKSSRHRLSLINMSRNRIGLPPPVVNTQFSHNEEELLKAEKEKLVQGGRWTFSLEARWKLKEDDREVLEKVHDLTKKRYLYLDPEQHPLYTQNWSSFWERRHDEITSAKGSLYADSYDYTKEWEGEWKRIMEPIFHKDFLQKLEDIYLKYRVDLDTLKSVWDIPMPHPATVLNEDRQKTILTWPGVEIPSPKIPTRTRKLPKPTVEAIVKTLNQPTTLTNRPICPPLPTSHPQLTPRPPLKISSNQPKQQQHGPSKITVKPQNKHQQAGPTKISRPPPPPPKFSGFSLPPPPPPPNLRQGSYLRPSVEDVIKILQSERASQNMSSQKDLLTVKQIVPLVQTLSDFYWVEEPTPHDIVYIITNSFRACSKSDLLNFEMKNLNSQDGLFSFKCELTLGTNKVDKRNLVIVGYGKSSPSRGKSEFDSKRNAVRLAASFIRRICPTLKVTFLPPATDKIVNPDDIWAMDNGGSSALFTPVDSSFGMKMLTKYGWNGGGLGVRDNGISEPINVITEGLNRGRKGLGINPRIPANQDRNTFRQCIQSYLTQELDNCNALELEFPGQLYDFAQFQIIRKEAAKLGYKIQDCRNDYNNYNQDVILTKKFDLACLVKKLVVKEDDDVTQQKVMEEDGIEYEVTWPNFRL